MNKLLPLWLYYVLWVLLGVLLFVATPGCVRSKVVKVPKLAYPPMQDVEVYDCYNYCKTFPGEEGCTSLCKIMGGRFLDKENFDKVVNNMKMLQIHSDEQSVGPGWQE